MVSLENHIKQIENHLILDKERRIYNKMSTKPVDRVIVHPLVLLSVVDHFNRMKKVGNTKRVVGLLLGSVRNKILDVSNSFASN
jgi:hypothetical protein